MGIDGVGKIFNSVFTKLFLVLLATGICIYLSVTLYFQCRSDQAEDPGFQKSMVYFLDHFIQDLGNPPDQDRARKIAQQTSIQIRYESPDQIWFTSESLAATPQAEWRTWDENPDVRVGMNPGGHYFSWSRGEKRFIIELPHPFTPDFLDVKDIIILTAILAGNLTGAYLLIRWILNPVRGLTEGVKEVGKGNLDHRVRFKRTDELGELAAAYNAMTERIRKMLRTKEQLLLDVSHELRSPLTRVKIALESVPPGDVRQSIGEDIIEMEKMISGILETGRVHHMHGRLNLQRINIVELLREVLPAFEVRPPGAWVGRLPDRVELQVDPERVKTVLKNILDNAVKYSRNSSEPVKVSLENSASGVTVRIRDHGVGIPADELPYVFEPFYRVDKSRSKDTGGYGLGLSLCKTIMEAHEGKIEIESSPQKGTTVSLFFPKPMYQEVRA